MFCKRIILMIFLLSAALTASAQGISFVCEASQVSMIQKQFEGYLHSLGIASRLYQVHLGDRTINYRIKSDTNDTSTLYIRWNPEFAIENEVVRLPSTRGFQKVRTVSKKEIVLALMHPGRKTEFSGKACNLEAFQDHVHVRQMIVAWAENLEWKFPDGQSASWNRAYWIDGTLRPGKPLLDAMTDFFINQEQCSVGCYTATKIVIIQGVLDYYARIKKDMVMVEQIKKTLMRDGEVLVDIEPDAMWNFLRDIKQSSQSAVGKLLTVQFDVAPYNFVPGDWVYFVNPDSETADLSGYEGSNSIYMGRARFDDFYNDNNHHYLYTEKLKEVYNWRYGVFSRSRDYERLRPMQDDMYHALSQTPKAGGLVFQNRAVPRFFGFTD